MLKQIFRRRGDDRTALGPLYDLIVREARQPYWYREGGVPDTVDGRFDMVATILALVLLRLEDEGPQTREAQALLAETFIDDMDGTLRQLGIGDLMVGKHVGRMMGALGGRLSAYRNALGDEAALADVVRRNIFRGEPIAPHNVTWVVSTLRAMAGVVGNTTYASLLAGEWTK